MASYFTRGLGTQVIQSSAREDPVDACRGRVFQGGLPKLVLNSAVLALFHPLGFDLVSQVSPAALSLGYLAKLWRDGELNGVQQAVFVAWFMTALAMQFATRGPWMWIAGWVGQVALAIALVMKKQIDDIY